jgi:two-component system, response regulator PdtaR
VSSLNNISILIVEDEALIAEDIKDICEESGYDVKSICYTASQALQAIDQNKYDLALLDINLEDDLNGIEIAQYINKKRNPIPFLFLTSYTDKTTLNDAKNVHPIGYIVKPFNKAQLISTIEVGMYNILKNKLQGELSKNKIEEKNKIELTDREFEILNLICQGKTNIQIAEKIYLSVNTIKFHIKNIYEKLDVKNRAKLMTRVLGS